MYYIIASKIIDFTNPTEIAAYYDNGYLFGRVEKGYSYKTRSLRIDLSKFEFSSENRRVANKFPNYKLAILNLPLAQDEYDWRIPKLAKDFYNTKFPNEKFSANKIKELISQDNQFNKLFKYSLDNNTVGYSICYQDSKILHYSYPFYDLNLVNTNLGMFMILESIRYAKSQNLDYFYIGGATRKADKYKLQFKGLEWHTGTSWSTDLIELKNILALIDS